MTDTDASGTDASAAGPTDPAAPDPARRAIELRRLATGRFVARNAAGAEVEFGHGEQLLSPVELLLAAIAGCSAMDVDAVTSRSAEATEFRVEATGRKAVDDEGGNRMEGLHLSFHLAFGDDAGGRKAAGLVERVVALSHDKLCTVSRTVEAGTPVGYDIAPTASEGPQTPRDG
jgi:putative redox protein